MAGKLQRFSKCSMADKLGRRLTRSYYTLPHRRPHSPNLVPGAQMPPTKRKGAEKYALIATIFLNQRLRVKFERGTLPKQALYRLTVLNLLFYFLLEVSPSNNCPFRGRFEGKRRFAGQLTRNRVRCDGCAIERHTVGVTQTARLIFSNTPVEANIARTRNLCGRRGRNPVIGHEDVVKRALHTARLRSGRKSYVAVRHLYKFECYHCTKNCESTLFRFYPKGTCAS